MTCQCKDDAELIPEETWDGMEDYDPTCPTNYEDDADDDWWDEPTGDYDLDEDD